MKTLNSCQCHQKSYEFLKIYNYVVKNLKGYKHHFVRPRSHITMQRSLSAFKYYLNVYVLFSTLTPPQLGYHCNQPEAVGRGVDN